MQATKPSDLEIVLTQKLAAPREKVFAALTQPEHVLQWMKPAHMKLVGCEFDLRAGGKLLYVFARPSGKKIEVRGVFEAVDRPRGFSFVETYDFSPLKVHVTTALEEADKRTIFRQVLRYTSKQERDDDYPGVADSSREAYSGLAKYLPQSSR